jgi:peptidoglycan/LPS O-acetylase OafA/YrhL
VSVDTPSAPSELLDEAPVDTIDVGVEDVADLDVEDSVDASTEAEAEALVTPDAGGPDDDGPALLAEAEPPVATAVTGRHLPALDGLRAFAVAGVVAYHLGWGWASGGYLGVDLFFVLSGFLITSLLLEERALTGRVRLAAFWARRARRLLPALLLMLTLIALFVVLDGRYGGPGAAASFDLSGLRGDALATLFYVANWHAIFSHQSYFAQFAVSSPLKHTWSLAIEEQFYLVWPLVLLVLLKVSRGAWRRVGLIVAVLGALASAGLMSLMYHGVADANRVYYGTDTHLFDMFGGIAVAMVVAARPQPGPRARRALHLAAPLCAVALGVFWVRAGTGSGLVPGWMYHGGFLLCAALAAVVIADVRQVEHGPLGAVLSLRPLRFLGRISYGVYLWHFPVIVYMTPARLGISGNVLDVVRIAATLLIATLSYRFVEMPIRRARPIGWRRFALAPAALAVTAAAVIVGTIPAVAAPLHLAPPTAPGLVSGAPVPGSGGYSAEKPIVLPAGTVVDRAHPLRVTLLGDSVLYGAAPGIAASLGATGEVSVTNDAVPGWGLTIDHVWPETLEQFIGQSHPQLIVATWSWDDIAALVRPADYRVTLTKAIDEMLAPGDGVSGVIFTQFPPTGPVLNFSTSASAEANAAAADKRRAEAERAWNAMVEALPHAFPGRVMYLPLAPSVLLNGKFSQWLPPGLKTSVPTSEWVRARMVDDVHLCPAGVVRYSSALLTDMTGLFHLKSAGSGWLKGLWTTSPVYNEPPGSCPDDHPPG